MTELDIGGKIAKLRKERGFTQKDLADFLGVTDKAVSRWESGVGNPDISLLPKIAKLLGTSTDYLLSASDDPLPTAASKPKASPKADEKPMRVVSTLSKTFMIVGSVLRCSILFLLAFRYRAAPKGMVAYFIGVGLIAIEAIICCIAFAKIDKASSRTELKALGVFGIIFCSIPAGILTLCIPKREFFEPTEKKESSSEKPRQGRIVAGLVAMGMGVCSAAASIACFGLPFFRDGLEGEPFTGFQVMFDFSNCFRYAQGSSGWLLFAFIGEIVLILAAIASACYWVWCMLKPGKADKASFKVIIFFGTLFMILGWGLGALIWNCDYYTGYKFQPQYIFMQYGVSLSTAFCIVGFNVCGIGFMIPLRRIVKTKAEENE